MKEIDSDMPNVMMDVLMKEQQQKNTKKWNFDPNFN
jgi:hypothetical protein